MIAAGLTYEIARLDEGSPGYAGLLNLVFESWARDFRLSPFARSLPKDNYFLWQRARIGRLLENGALLLVCRNPDAPDKAYAWLCADREGDAVRFHYAYTKAFARRQGMFTALMEHALTELGDGAEVVTYTHDPAKQHEGEVDARWRKRLNGMGLEYRPLPELAGRAA